MVNEIRRDKYDRMTERRTAPAVLCTGEVPSDTCL
jgi:hypothetical protein